MMNVVRRWDSIFQENLPEPRGPPQSFEAHKFLKMHDFFKFLQMQGVHTVTNANMRVYPIINKYINKQRNLIIASTTGG